MSITRTPTTRLHAIMGRLERSGMMVVVAICKLVLLAGLFEASACFPEVGSEGAEPETACACERVDSHLRSTISHRLASRLLKRNDGPSRQDHHRPLPGSCPIEHRLANGHCAAMRC